MENQTLSIIAVAASAITLLILIGEKLFGGGNRLAAMFAKLDKETTAAITTMRIELSARVDDYEDNYQVGFDAIKANIHAMQIGLLEFRAKMAEEYMHKGDYGAGINEIKTDMREGFDRLERRLERIERPNGPHSKSS